MIRELFCPKCGVKMMADVHEFGVKNKNMDIDNWWCLNCLLLLDWDFCVNYMPEEDLK